MCLVLLTGEVGMTGPLAAHAPAVHACVADHIHVPRACAYSMVETLSPVFHSLVISLLLASPSCSSMKGNVLENFVLTRA